MKGGEWKSERKKMLPRKKIYQSKVLPEVVMISKRISNLPLQNALVFCRLGFPHDLNK